MNVFKKIEKGLRKVKDKIVDDIIPTGSAAKRAIRKAIPNELADLAVKVAPIVAPFNPGLAAAMRGIGRFDQRGSISDALKQGAMMYGGGKLVGMIPGTGNYFGQGLEGAKALGSDAMSGITSVFKGGGKNAAADILGKSSGPSYDLSGMGTGGGGITGGGITGAAKNIGSKILDYGKEYAFGDDKKFQMGDIGRFLGDPGKTIPLTMIASYIKEKFFPDEDQDSFDAKFAEAMRKRGENVESYLQQYGPFDPRRDPTKNPYTQEEIDQFAKDKTIEYRNVAADGGLMTLPRENYFLGSKPFVRSFTAKPGSPGAVKEVTPDDILNVFKAKFDRGDFFKSRNPFKRKAVVQTFEPQNYTGNAPDPEDIMKILDNKESGKLGLGKLMVSLLRDANFDREEAAMGGRMNYASGSEGIMMASNPDPMDERNQVLEMMAMQTFGKPLRDLSDDQIIELEEMFDDFISSGQPLPSDPTKPINPFAPKPTGPALPDKQMASMAVGGRVNYAMGGDTPEENAMQAAGIEGLDININPKGITELDMRETGGFIPPVGVKEKEDDIPAMLSNNEFVFTADAVRGMGDGDVDKGAERMYSMMKKLEDGGRV